MEDTLASVDDLCAAFDRELVEDKRVAAEAAYALAFRYRNEDVDGRRRFDLAGVWATHAIELLDELPSDTVAQVASTRMSVKVTPSAMRAGPVGQLMSLPISMDVSTMGAELQKAPDVDHAFLAMMIPHHAGAVMMADQEQKTGTSPTLKQLAGAIISSQSQQIGQMQAMFGAGA
jgi:Domain of unknown function (DUF305)